MKPEYSIQIIWSREDGAYVAAPLELPGCAADGETPEEALKNVRVVIQEWIEVAKEEGRDIPPPMSLEDHQKLNDQFQANVQQQIHQQVQNAVQQVILQIAGQQQPGVWSNTTFRGVDLEPAGKHRR